MCVRTIRPTTIELHKQLPLPFSLPKSVSNRFQPLQWMNEMNRDEDSLDWKALIACTMIGAVGVVGLFFVVVYVLWLIMAGAMLQPGG